MTRDETKKLLMLMEVHFQSFKPTNLSLMVDSWQMALDDYPYSKIEAAFMAYIRSNRSGFAPTVGQLLGMIEDYEDKSMNDAEAWAMVHKAVRRANWHAEEDFERFPEVVKKAVGSPANLREWALVDDDAILVAESHFKKRYESAMKMAKNERHMTDAIKIGTTEERGLLDEKHSDQV